MDLYRVIRGIYVYNIYTDSLSQILFEGTGEYSDYWNKVFNVYEDKDGYSWILTARGLIRYKTNTKVIKKYFIDDPITLYTVLEDSMNNLWIGTYSRGLLCFNRKTEKYDFYNYSDGLQSNRFNLNSAITIEANRRIIFWRDGWYQLFSPT